jgi:hypothetical protein
MPSIKHNGFSLIIRTNDHPPPHVHVIRGEVQLGFSLGNRDEERRCENALDTVKTNKKSCGKNGER